MLALNEPQWLAIILGSDDCKRDVNWIFNLENLSTREDDSNMLLVVSLFISPVIGLPF